MALGSTQPLTEMSARNISWRGKGGGCVGLTTLPPSCADCLEIWEPQPPGALRACPDPVRGLLFSSTTLESSTEILKTFHVQTLPDLRQGSVLQTFVSLEFQLRRNSTLYVRNHKILFIYTAYVRVMLTL
jgi:hypothetical protein